MSIVGLTASGKSAIGIKIAKKFNGEIISADSRQVYKRLDIGTAKVTHAEMDGVKHHLIDVIDPIPATKNTAHGVTPHFDVYEYQRQAYEIIDDILRRGKLPIIVGGTGLYSRAVVEGYAFGKQPAPRYDAKQFCLLPPKEYIRPIIEKRIDERLKNGMIEETRDLIRDGVSGDWLKSLGLEYYWNMEYIDGRVTIDEYKERLLMKTMQFAKRQRTWFKREKNAVFLTGDGERDFFKYCYDKIESGVANFVNNSSAVE